MTDTPAPLFDRAAYAHRRHRAAALQHDHGFLFQEVAERMADRLLDINRTFEVALDLGARTGALSTALGPTGKITWMCQSDISAAMISNSAATVPGACLIQDEEWLAIKPKSLDLVLSNLSLHWVNDLPGALIQIRQALKPDGLFLGSLFGGETLHELKHCLTTAEVNLTGGLSPRFSPAIDIRDAGGLLQRAGFNLPVTDSERLTLLYPSAFHLFRELRGMGETNVLTQRARTIPPRALFLEAARLYHEQFGDAEGRIPATFDVLTLTAWTPHESQQKPLTPGSGETNLNQVL